MAENYEGRWEFVKRNKEAIDMALDLEARGFNVEAYLQDIIDDKVKPRRCYWQIDQAEGPKSES